MRRAGEARGEEELTGGTLGLVTQMGNLCGPPLSWIPLACRCSGEWRDGQGWGCLQEVWIGWTHLCFWYQLRAVTCTQLSQRPFC